MKQSNGQGLGRADSVKAKEYPMSNTECPRMQGSSPPWTWAIPSRVLGVAVCALALVALPAARAADRLERQFLWDEANTQMGTAQTADDFLRAARTYGRLVEAGARNGPLFHNLGAALVKAGRYEQATPVLLRAERYMGNTPDLRQNLLVAAARGQADALPSLPWYRPLLFWHYGLATRTRFLVAAAAFSLAWLAVAFRLLGWQAGARPLLATALVVLVLFGSSTLTSLHQEAAQPPLLLADTPGAGGPAR